MLVRELLDSSNFLFAQLDLLEVLCNPGRCNGLGDDGMTANLAPSKDNLSGRGTLLLSDSLNLRACDEEGDIEKVVAEGGVSGNVDVLLLGVGNELLARKDGVTLDLVNCRDKIRLLNQRLQILVCEVGNAYRAGLALGEFTNSLPCLAVRNRVVDVDLVNVGGGREKVRVRVLARAEVDWPVDEIEVKVVKLELGKGVIKSSFNVLRVVLGVPELASDEDILTFEAGNVLEGTLDAISDFLLVLVADWCENY